MTLLRGVDGTLPYESRNKSSAVSVNKSRSNMMLERESKDRDAKKSTNSVILTISPAFQAIGEPAQGWRALASQAYSNSVSRTRCWPPVIDSCLDL
jgi:hypothetical protein